MFNNCDFVLGGGNSVIIVIPERLPYAETYTVSVSNKDIKFKADYEDIVQLDYQGGEVYERIAKSTQIALVEYDGHGDFPSQITHVAYVEVRRAS